MSDNEGQCKCLSCMIIRHGEVDTWSDIDNVKTAYKLLKEDYERSALLSQKDTIRAENVYNDLLKLREEYNNLTEFHVKLKAGNFSELYEYKKEISKLNI